MKAGILNHSGFTSFVHAVPFTKKLKTFEHDVLDYTPAIAHRARPFGDQAFRWPDHSTCGVERRPLHLGFNHQN